MSDSEKTRLKIISRIDKFTKTNNRKPTIEEEIYEIELEIAVINKKIAWSFERIEKQNRMTTDALGKKTTDAFSCFIAMTQLKNQKHTIEIELERLEKSILEKESYEEMLKLLKKIQDFSGIKSPLGVGI